MLDNIWEIVYYLVLVDMKESRVLWKINSLEKMIAKEFINNVSEDKVIPCLSGSQLKIMHFMFINQDRDIYQKDLEDILHISRAGVSGVLHTMEKNGLIKRITSKEDVRCKRIELNDLAYKRFMQGKEKFYLLEEAMLKGLSEKDIIEFNNIIDKMQKNLIDFIGRK